MLAANRFGNQRFHDQAGNAAIPIGEHLVLIVKRWTEGIKRIRGITGKRIRAKTKGTSLVGSKKCADGLAADSVLLHQMVLERHSVKPSRDGVAAILRYLSGGRVRRLYP